MPEVRDRLGLSLSGLGVVLLAVGLGGLVSSVVGGLIVDRSGSRRVATVASVLLAAGLPLIGIAPTGLTLGIALFVLSMVDALADIGMNVQAAEVQRRIRQSVVQRFHALWSIGTVFGAGVGAGAAALDVGLTAQLTVTAVVLVVVVVVASAGLVAEDTPQEISGGGRRGPGLTILAALAAVVAVVEGTPNDWAAVFVSDVHGAAGGTAGLGYVAVASGMVLGRLAGDRATDVFGGRRLFNTALGVILVGVAVVAASPSAVVAIVGFAVVGLGISVLFPAIYLQAASTPGVPAGLGVGVMSTGARLGFLVSPPFVGTVSDIASLRTGLALVIGTAAVASSVLTVALGRIATSTPPAGRTAP